MAGQDSVVDCHVLSLQRLVPGLHRKDIVREPCLAFIPATLFCKSSVKDCLSKKEELVVKTASGILNFV